MYEYVMLLLVLLSTLGFAEGVKAKLRLPLVVLIPCVQACQTILMFISGFCHGMHIAAWLLLVIGNLLWMWRWLVSLKAVRGVTGKTFCRLFRFDWIAVLVPCLLVFSFYMFNTFKDWSADFQYCWYNHYYFLLSQGRWADAAYTNYAHCYCMIGNAYACYLGVVLRDSGMNLYSYSMMLLSMGASLPLLAYVKWKYVSFEMMLVVAALIFGRLYAGWILWLIPIFLLVALLRKFFCGGRAQAVRTLIMNVMVSMVLGMVLMLSAYGYWTPVSYPFDTLLGIYALGLLALFLYGCYSTVFWWRLLPVEIVMLMVLTHIKPTGMIPAIFLALLIAVGSLVHLLKTRKTCSRRAIVVKIAASLFALAVPFIMFFSWQSYCSHLGWQWHESVDRNKLAHHLAHGLSERELKDWRDSFVSGSGLMPTSQGETPAKGWLMISAEHAVGWLLREFNLDPDEKFRQVCQLSRKNAFHHVACLAILIPLCILMVACLRSRKVMSIFLLLTLLLFYLLVCFNQYFFMPMYTKVPPLFRYVYYGFSLPYGLFVFLCWRMMANRRYACLCIVWILFAFGFEGLLLQQLRTSKDNGERYSLVGAGILMNKAASGGCKVVNSCQYDNRMAGFLNDSGLAASDHSYAWKLYPSGSGSFLFYTGESDFGRIGKGVKVKGSFDQRGFYYTPRTNGKTINFTKVYCDEEALALISKAYSDRNWSRLRDLAPIQVLSCKGGDALVDDFVVTEADGRDIVSAKNSFYCFRDDTVILAWKMKRRAFSSDSATARLTRFWKGKAVATESAVPLVKTTDDMTWYEVQFPLAGMSPLCYDRYKVEISIAKGRAQEMLDVELAQRVSGCLDLVSMVAAQSKERK